MEHVKLKQLGELLRQQREEKNFSLKEVENATSIRTAYLKAIEGGEVANLISPVYAQGFIKQYAFFMGLDGDQLVKEYQDAFGVAEKQNFAYGIGTLEPRGPSGVSVRWIPYVFYGVLIIGLLTLAWYFARYIGLL